MYKARHYKTDGTKAGDRDLPIWLFDGIVNESVLHQAVRAYLLNQRQGSASAKARSDVRGGSRKPWRQKGTGRARQGTIRAAQWAGGGVVFPPKPKSWRVDLPKKVRRLAHRSAFNARADEGRVVIVDELSFDAPRTRRLREVLESLETEGKVLLLTDGPKENVYLSGRNLPEVHVLPFGEESAYDVLWAGTVVIEIAALESADEVAKEKGLVAEAENRIERAKARKEAKAEARAEREAARAAKKSAQRKRDAARAGKPEGGKPKKKKAPKAEKKAPKKEETKAEKKAPKKEETKAEKKAAPKQEAPKAAPEAEAVDVDAIDLPTVKELADFLAEFDDVETIRALQERDDRKTAQRHYDARIEELTGGEESDD